MPKMILYTREHCVYADRVLDEADRLGIELELRDISDPATAEDLIERGGKRQVPYLVDVENAVEMYESEDIVEYFISLTGGLPPDVAIDEPELE